MAEITYSTCTTCNGEGIYEDEICPDCIGGGSIPVRGFALYLKTQLEAISDRCDDITDKCNDIFEQLTE